MNKIYKSFSNSLHSFILLPLLVTNISVGVDSKIDLSALEDKIRSGFGASEIIDEQSALLEEQKIKAAKIDAYFGQWDLPASGYGLAMVKAADKYGIDWRLLPALAKLETTGGKHVCKNPKGVNNWFGWGSCKIRFDSVEESFDIIAKNLSGNNPNTEHYYKDKSVAKILEVYNPPATPGITPNYHKLAFKIMDEIENIEIDQGLEDKNVLVFNR
ncbi:MAG: glucosaminidase domain-containing protein [Candidatus Paceibacterota bacterium]